MSDPQPASRKPIEQALDVFFYAPIGFLMNADEVVPQLIERGRQQVQMARMFGQFAVQQGQRETEKLSGRVQGQATGLFGQLLERAGGRRPAPSRPAAPAAPSAPVGADQPEPATPEPSPDVETLAIPDYDSLSASQVVPRLAGLSSGELEEVRSYEAANRGRKTILNKVAQLQGALIEEGLRPATTGDLARVTELAREAIAELRTEKGGEVWFRRDARPEPIDAGLAAAIADTEVLVLVGTLDDEIIGYAVVHVVLVPDGGELAVVDDLYVEAGARGVGVGEMLIDAIVAWARGRGCFGIDAIALPGARETKNFFEGFGLVARAIVVHRSL